MPSPQSEFGPRTQALLPQLSLEEKAALTAGAGLFNFAGVERVGIPDWQTTDGPNGARGSSFLGSGDSKATCIPCGSALGATWNPTLVEELGKLLGAETRTKACRVLLAPTVNLHRSPLAGRNFECFSEDPLLSGRLAAAYVRGAQSQGVITTVKHFVGNECETDRWTSNSIIDERSLRELYLVPFELAVTEGGTLGIMTSYNRVNGSYCTEQKWLLTDVLRHEWGFEGVVTTDWVSGGNTELSAAAGLTIEMPAGNRAMGSVLGDAVRDGKVAEATLDELAGRMLSVFESIGAWDDEPAAEQSIDLPEHRALARRAAAEAMVLLRNEAVGDGASQTPILPLDVQAEAPTIAVIGPNADRAQIMGGGSANLRPFHRTTPLDAINARLGDLTQITFSPGCNIDKQAPLLSGASITAPDGEQGFRIEVFESTDFSGEPVGSATRDTSRILFGDEVLPGLELSQFSLRATAIYTAPVDGEYVFEYNQVTPSKVFLNGDLVVDGVTSPPPIGGAFLGMGAIVEPAVVTLNAGTSYEIVIELAVESYELFGGAELRVGAPFPDDALERAVAAAADADIAVVVVGTNDDWETEGEDRAALGLPGEQDVLVSAVVAANPRTVVVVNTGSPVSMPWAGEVPAIVQTWLGGQEMSDALVDVLTGDVDPGGRLPTTFPQRIEHTPSFGNFPGDNGQVPYAEGIMIGYRWYDSRHLPVLFPFGHGLSYTKFDVGAPEVAEQVRFAQPTPTDGRDGLAPGDDLVVRVPVTNSGHRRGSHVVQCYVRPHASRIMRPAQELKAFAKVALDPGESAMVELRLDARAFAYWDPAQPEWPRLRSRQAETLPMLVDQERRTEPGWTIEAGAYDLVIAHSAADVAHVATVEVAVD